MNIIEALEALPGGKVMGRSGGQAKVVFAVPGCTPTLLAEFTPTPGAPSVKLFEPTQDDFMATDWTVA